MKIKKEKARTCYLQETAVENIFLNEYMPDAPDSFVKVYLLALMYAGMEETGSIESEIAKTLRVPVSEVSKALDYWSRSGVIRKTADGITFLSLREQLYGSHNEDVITPDASRRLMNDEKISAMFSDIEQLTKEFLQPTAMQQVLSWMTDYDASCELITEAYRYCAGLGKTDIRYVGAVVKNWAGRGLSTKEEIEEFLGQMDQRHAVYRQIMQALGFSRNATQFEKKIISSWIDELGVGMDEIMDACSRTTGISNPNINYVDSVLRNRRPQPKTRATRNLIMEQYEKLRRKAEDEAASRREKVYNFVPRIRSIDEEMKETSMELTRSLLGGGSGGADALRSKIAELEHEREVLLTENDIPVDYMDVRYNCRICKDTGITDTGERCSCYEVIAKQIQG